MQTITLIYTNIFLLILFISCQSASQKPVIVLEKHSDSSNYKDNDTTSPPISFLELNQNKTAKKQSNLTQLIKELKAFPIPLKSKQVIVPLVEKDEYLFFSIVDSLNKFKIYSPNLLFNDTHTGHSPENYNYDYPAMAQKIYPLYKKTHPNYYTVGSLMEYTGDNDIMGASFRLTNFDHTGKQLDYLIVYDRFLFEILYETDCTIDQDFNIFLTTVETHYFDENGPIEEGETPEQFTRKEHFVINELGHFELVSKSK